LNGTFGEVSSMWTIKKWGLSLLPLVLGSDQDLAANAHHKSDILLFVAGISNAVGVDGAGIGARSGYRRWIWTHSVELFRNKKIFRNKSVISITRGYFDIMRYTEIIHLFRNNRVISKFRVIAEFELFRNSSCIEIPGPQKVSRPDQRCNDIRWRQTHPGVKAFSRTDTKIFPTLNFPDASVATIHGSVRSCQGFSGEYLRPGVALWIVRARDRVPSPGSSRWLG
jgi:hypothetical protein